MAANKIKAKSVNQRRYIKLHGMYGTFDLDHKSVKVRYFSTAATGDSKQTDSYELLKELKPMRERVKANQIKDLSFLLQRNLDDYRVAQELVPYLIKNPNIAFFPAVLAVIIPKNTLNTDSQVDYPKPMISIVTDGSENQLINYHDQWMLELFNIDDKISKLGMLSIDINDIDVIVLDGQHRANAFRVASGAFSDKDSSVYPAFYKDMPATDGLDADLPITLIWFEYNKDEFDPKRIARKLFVDVNNSAKKVSKSRKILLNDYEIPSLLTRFFYSSVAKSRGFSLDQYSLFHSEFDKDSDIATSSNNVMAITNPEFVYEIVYWLTLGPRGHNVLSVYKSRDIFKSNLIAFGSIFDSTQFNGKDIEPDEEGLNYRFIAIKDDSKIDVFNNEYLEKLDPMMMGIFSEFNLFVQHYKACAELGKWYEDGMNTTQMLVWDEVFCGGEGLYYTFNRKEIKSKANQALKSYIQAIGEIERKLKQHRASYFDGCSEKDINDCYESVTTKAFQVGLFMALDVYRGKATFLEVYESFLLEINKKKPRDWVVIMTDIKQALISGVDPKLWPSYQKLILRVIQGNNDPYYDDQNFLFSPDGQIFKAKLSVAFEAWWQTMDDLTASELSITDVTLPIIHKWGITAKNEIDAMFKKANVEPIPRVNIEAISQDIVAGFIADINPA